MKCRQSRRLFGRHLDGRLSDGEKGSLELHLAGCAGCRAELARWELASVALRSVGPARAPGLAERTWRGVVKAGARPASFEERFVWAARKAAVVGVLAAALVWGGVLWDDPGENELALPPDVAEMAMSLLAPPSSSPSSSSEVDVDDQ